MSNVCYPESCRELIDIIRSQYTHKFNDTQQLDEFIEKGGWKARKNGRDLELQLNYKEYMTKSSMKIIVTNPLTDWKIWINTIGELLGTRSPYLIMHRGKTFEISVKEKKDSLEVAFSSDLLRTDPLFTKLLKNVFRRSACCVHCQACAADCPYGFITMSDGVFSIDPKCHHCSQCHIIEKGCLLYKSLEMPKGESNMDTKSLNCYSHHAPKMDWFNQYFQYKNEFDQKHSLGSQMYSFFRRFLRDACLLDAEGFTSFADKIDAIGLGNITSWALMLVNLTYTPQINWYVCRVPFNSECKKEYITTLLVSDGAKESWVNDVWSSFVRILELPFGDVGMGCANKEKNRFVSLTRTPWRSPDPRVILYSLYKFAEACGDYHQFSLSRLLDHEVESAGISPTLIFGLDRDTMEKLLNGLSENYPSFINATFTHDLDTITLRSEKTSIDVLSELF